MRRLEVFVKPYHSNHCLLNLSIPRPRDLLGFPEVPSYSKRKSYYSEPHWLCILDTSAASRPRAHGFPGQAAATLRPSKSVISGLVNWQITFTNTNAEHFLLQNIRLSLVDVSL